MLERRVISINKSLYIGVPKQIADSLDIGAGSGVTIEVRGRSLIVRPVVKQKQPVVFEAKKK